VVEGEARGCFPCREKDGRILFPHKTGRFWVTGWELLAAQELKLVSDLKILVCYQPAEIKDISNFSNTLYNRKLSAKLSGDVEEEFFNKIAVNCGYGKLALNPTKFSEVKVTGIFDKPDYLGENGKVISEAKAEKLGQKLWENCWDDSDRGLSFWKRSSYREGIDKFVNVATAASITGFVRAKLLRAKHQAGGAVYCDTDSLILKNLKGLKFGQKLGDWKLELTCDSAVKKGQRRAVEHDSGLWIGGKKLYAGYGRDPEGKWKWKKASKGVNLSAERIVAVARGEKQTMTFNAPTYSLFTRPKFVTRQISKQTISSPTGEKGTPPRKFRKSKKHHGRQKENNGNRSGKSTRQHHPG
jgi:hypothetical protein